MDTRLWLALILITSFAHFTASNNRIDYADFPNIRVRLCRFIQVVGTICVFIFPPEIWKNVLLNRFGAINFFWYYLCNAAWVFIGFALCVGIWCLVIYILNTTEKDLIKCILGYKDKKSSV